MVEAIKVNPSTLAHELDLPIEKAEATLALLEAGFPAPFIIRYRKDQTNLDRDEDVVRIAAAYEKQRKFADRKFSYLKTLESRGELTPELEKMIRETRAPHRLDDLYLPFKNRRPGEARTAVEAGLEPLADAILNAADESVALEELAAQYVNAEKNIATAEQALEGAAAIIAEKFAETFDLRQNLRGYVLHNAKLATKRADTDAVEALDLVAAPVENAPEAELTELVAEEAPAENVEAETASVDESVDQAQVAVAPEKNRKRGKSADEARIERLAASCAEYFDAVFELRGLSRDRIQTIDRGEESRILTVSLLYDAERVKEIAREALVAADRPYAAFLTGIAEKAAIERTMPDLEQETRADLMTRALDSALDVVSRNLRNRLLQKPLPRRRVLGVDAGVRNTTKIAALDEYGNVIASDSISVKGGEDKRAAAEAKVAELVKKFGISVFALRAGAARAKVEPFFAKLIEDQFADQDVAYIEVSDIGLDEYAGSKLAQTELALYDAGVRAAVSLGRRIQNPLAELVKVSPEALCDDAFCRKIHVRTLREALRKVVALCVARVGLDANRASETELRFVPGFNDASAKSFVDYRREHGPFRSRDQFKNVVGVSDAAYALCSGFLKITDGTNPLDATWIHPESYDLATKILAKLGFEPDALRCCAKRAEIAEAAKNADAAAIAEDFAAGSKLVASILAELVSPGADARDSEPAPIFKKRAIKLSEIQPGMELTGVVTSVSNFGAFVDVGAATSGLVHISQLSVAKVRDARQAVAVGDVIKVWTLGVDPERNRISLTAIKPGTPREKRDDRRGRRGDRPERSDRPERGGERGERRAPRDAAETGRQPREQRQRLTRRDDDSRDSGERRRERAPRRGDRSRDDRDRAPRSAQVAPKEKAAKPLSESKKSGKEQLQSFSELKQFFDL